MERKIKKTILILGSSGFIGRNLVEQLGRKYKLLTPRHSELDLTLESEVSSYFKSSKIDVVINAVVVGGSRKEEHEENALRNNLLMFFNILKNKKHFKKLIHLGSGAEYDKSRPIIKVKESDFGKRIPKDDYGLFKFICSKIIEKEDKIICLRLFGLFGKYEDYRYRFISNAIVSNLRRQPIVINQNVFFDYVYIDDFIKIIDYFINNNAKYKFYNIGSGQKVDILSIAEIINQVANRKSKIIIKNKGLNKENTCDNHHLIEEVKNKRFTNIKKSIKQLYLWYKNNLSEITWKKN